MALTAPFAATFADRMDRKRLMVLCDLVRAVLVSLGAACLFLDTPPWPVFVIAALAAVLGAPFRIAQRALLPSLVDRPEELTASNGASSTIESVAFFVGPALGALLLGFTTVEVVFLVNVLTFLWSMLLITRLDVRVTAGPAEETDPGPDEPAESFLKETGAGFRTIAGDRDLLFITAAVSAQTIVAGAAAVFMVVMADDILGTGARGIGYLDSLLGVGAILGGLVAISRAAKNRLAADLTVGVVLWSLPLLLVTAWPHPVACFVAMALLGFGNPLVDTNLDTIVQRITPDAVLGRVFGALEACLIATMSLGAVVMPFLIHWFDLRWALVCVAVPIGALALLGLPVMRGLDRRLREPAALPLLRGIDLFTPLSPAVLDTLAGALSEQRYAAGDVLVREGAESDLFYIIESGQVEVTQGSRVLRREGPGEYFGEIGLLRDVPRTATITAVEETVVQTLSREHFLRAVSGHRDSSLAAERVVNRRLAV
jgi:MFS family permease